MSSNSANRLAILLKRAWDSRSPLEKSLGIESVDEAYDVQASLARMLGGLIAGWRVALATSNARKAFGAEEPVYAPILDWMLLESGSRANLEELAISPRAEPETAVIIGSDISRPLRSSAEALAYIAAIVPAIDLVDSRFRDWSMSLTDLVADMAGGRLVVVAESERLDVKSWRDVCVVLKLDGEPVACGLLSESLGGPIESLVWLSKKLHSRGLKLRRGDIVLTGSPVTPVKLGKAGIVETSLCGLSSARIVLG